MGFERVEPDEIALRTPFGTEDPIERTLDAYAGPSVVDTITASARQNNMIVSAINGGHQPFKRVEGYTPWMEIEGTPYYDEFADEFVGSHSPEETAWIKGRVDQKVKDDATRVASGTFGWVADIGTGLVDPFLAAPGGNIYKGVKVGRAALKTAASTAAWAAAAAGGYEAVMHQTQIGRTAGDSIFNIGAATVMGGILGGAFSRFASTAERRAATDAFAKVQRDSLADAAGIPEGEAAYAGGASTVGSSAGAAAADTRTLEPVGLGAVGKAYTKGIEALRKSGVGKPLAAVLDAPAALVRNLGPVQRVLYGKSVAARRATADLVDTAGILVKENLTGGSTVRGGGPSVETHVRLATQGARYRMHSEMDRLYNLYFWGKESVTGGKIRAAYAIKTGQGEGKMSFEDFSREVAYAMRRSDTHANPQIAEAAKFLRKDIVEPWKEAAIKAKLLPEDVDVKTAASYLTRLYDHEKIVVQRPKFKQTVTDWLRGTQARNLEIQDTLRLYSEDLNNTRDIIDKLSGKKGTREEALADLEARQEELNRLNKFTYSRAETLRKSAEPESEFIETRGGGTRYHGSPNEVTGLDEGHYTSRNYYGQGFYTTDGFDIAHGYSKKKGGKSPSHYRVEEVGPVNAFDMEQPIPDWLVAHAKEDKIYGADELVAEALEDTDVKTVRDLYDNVRDYSSGGGFTADDVQSAFETLAEKFRENGYNALDHRGGLRTKKKEHAVRIYLEPEKQIKLHPVVPDTMRAKLDSNKVLKAQGGSVFETKIKGRGNTLADQASGKAHDIESLEEALARYLQHEEDLRTKIEDLLGRWEGDTTAAVKSALKAREKAATLRHAKQFTGVSEVKEGRLTSADEAVDKAVKDILEANKDLSDQELGDLADEITRRILSTPDGRLSYDAAKGGPNVGAPREGPPPRGPLAERLFMIPDELIEPWLVNDVERVMNSYLHTMVPDVLLTNRFGDVDMDDAFRQLRDENSKGVLSESEYKAAVRDLAVMRDRVRRTYGHTDSESMKNAGRIAQSLGHLNVLADMGGSALSQILDPVGIIARYGFMDVFRDAYIPFFRGLTQKDAPIKEAMGQYRAMGIGVESAIDYRPLAEVGEEFHPRTKTERTLKAASNYYMLANLSAPITSKAKGITAVVVGNEIIKAAKALVAGKATAKQLRNLGEASITPELAEGISKNFDISGEIKDGVYLPNTVDWTDDNARLAFEGAVSREVDIAVVTPGQEKSIWLSHPVARILGQFKSFTNAATTRILLANLQRRDAATLQGVVAQIAMGMLGYKAYSIATGRETSDDPATWVKEGVSRAGLGGWLDEGNSMLAKFSGGKFDMYRLIGADKPLSRQAARSLGGALAGPTWGKLENAIQLLYAVADGQMTQSDLRAARRLLPFQNLFYLRQLLDQVQDSAGSLLPKRRDTDPDWQVAKFNKAA